MLNDELKQKLEALGCDTGSLDERLFDEYCIEVVDAYEPLDGFKIYRKGSVDIFAIFNRMESILDKPSDTYYGFYIAECKRTREAMSLVDEILALSRCTTI